MMRMIEKRFNIEKAIYELGVLLCDETQGLLLRTLKKDFYKEYEEFDIITAWDCLVDEVNRLNTVCELYDFLVDNLEKLKELEND